MDLHRRLLPDGPQGLDGPVWQHATSSEVESLSVLVPSPVDALLLACAHGWRWTATPSIRWIHDAVTVARHLVREDDWTRLIEEARRRQLSLRLSRVCRLIHDRFGAPIPRATLTALESGPFAFFEAAEERHATRRPGRLVPGLARAYFAHAREHGRPNGLRWWTAAGRRAWFTSNVPSGLTVVPWLARWIARRLNARPARLG